MLCSHCPINDSPNSLHITVYLAVKLQACWHTAEVNLERNDSYIKSLWVRKLYNIKFAYHRYKNLARVGTE